MAYRGRVFVQVPASTSNLGSGFDALGMALQIHSRYELAPPAKASIRRERDEPSFSIEAYGLNAENIPTDADNITYRAFRLLFDRAGETPPDVSIRILNGIPLERGLGGSASAILGGLLGANAWLETPLSDEDILRLASELDGHPDNVAPSLFGGLRVACWDGERVCSLPVPCSDELQIVLAVPTIRVATAAARDILPQTLAFRDAVFNVGRVALLVSAFASANFAYLEEGMRDRLHQPYRRTLIPQMDAVFAAAKSAGAWSVALSGSGPTIAAYCTGSAEEVGEAMKNAFAEARIHATIHLTAIDSRGAMTTLPDEDEIRGG